jgi:hypothetical protein
MEGRNQDLPSFDFVLRSYQEGDSSTAFILNEVEGLTVPEQGRRELAPNHTVQGLSNHQSVVVQ